jgi:L-lactate dehydrogenase complex protein LldF
MGIEKVVEKLSDIPPLLDILVRSATGQSITSYFNMISSPRRRGDKDGPGEVHLVLLDNGRSGIYRDRELDATLRCIRCGACMNHCPVYSRLGGHAYPGTIPGPIGALLEPQIAGLHRLGALPTASTLCGACSEVCPVGIPIPELLNRLRAEGVRKGSGGIAGSGSRRRFRETLVWRFWEMMCTRPRIYRGALSLAARMPSVLTRLFGPWTRSRTLPVPAGKSLHVICRDRGLEHE